MEAAVRSLSDDVAREIGARVVDGHPEAVSAVVDRFLADRGLTVPLDADTSLTREPALREQVISALTNGETYFFRGADQWDLLRDRVLPEAVAGRSADASLRLWSAGCASGEEPYTLAMVLDELGLGRRAEVLGTDVSAQALAAARRATYGRWSLRSPQAQTRMSWFQEEGGRYRLDRRLADRVSFRPLNLLDDGDYPYAGAADVILCRNVLLHMTREAAATVARRLLDTLAPRGWLLLAAGDPALAGPGSLDVPGAEAIIFETGSIAYRRDPGSSMPVDRARIRAVRPRTSPVAPKRVEHRIGAARPIPTAAAGAAGGSRDEPVADEQTQGAAVRLDAARTALAHGRADEALTAATAASFLEPGLAAAHLTAGIAAWRLDEPDVAARAFRRAVALLAALPADEVVPQSDGEVAGRLRTLAEDYIGLVERRPVQP